MSIIIYVINTQVGMCIAMYWWYILWITSTSTKLKRHLTVGDHLHKVKLCGNVENINNQNW